MPFMRGCKWTGHAIVPSIAGGVFVLYLAGFAWAGDGPDQIGRPPAKGDSRVSVRTPGRFQHGIDLEFLVEQPQRIGRWLLAWYVRTQPSDRVIWGGLAACAGLGLSVLIERVFRLRPRKVVPADFTARFLDRLYEGKLDCGEALDHCERNPSPAARVALAAVRRWGRPPADLERAVALAHKVETERLRRNVGTLRRVAALALLLGLLGTLFAAERALQAIPPMLVDGAVISVESAPLSVAWGPALAAALSPLSSGIIIATLALVAYDGLLTRIEKQAGALDRLGAETIDAIALAAPMPTPIIALGNAPSRTPHQSLVRRDGGIDVMRRSGPAETGP
jgi:biopolymer transport protein ExbB